MIRSFMRRGWPTPPPVQVETPSTFSLYGVVARNERKFMGGLRIQDSGLGRSPARAAREQEDKTALLRTVGKNK